MLTPPTTQRPQRMKHLARRITQTNAAASPCAHNIPFLNPYETSSGPLSKTHCLSCGRYPPDSAMKPYSGTPLPQYGMENKVNICQPCLIGQGVLRHVSSLTGLYACDAHERVALMKGRDLAAQAVEKVSTEKENGNNQVIQPSNSSECLQNVVVTPEMLAAMMKLINGASFLACRRRSCALDYISSQLENGAIGAAEFLELLNEYAHEAVASSTLQTETIKMKKEALMVAGDMRAAIKMLHEHALPKSSGNGRGVAPSSNTEMLSCILEFFLDLCEQGELSSVAFFWPQLCQIHMQMLPATDSESLARIELVEDFLLTVCCRHSVHLGLEIVWSCIADLEDSVGHAAHGSSVPAASCRRRRFAVMRFICELESLIFDLDGGWGGGSVSMRGMFAPSDHQSTLIKNAMGILQMHRRFSSHHLSRSSRLDKLNAEAAVDEEGEEANANMSAECAIDAAKRKYQIARNAEYFSTQLMFCRRLGDIAEKLRFMEVEERVPALENELEIFNASGRLGGDPLNIACDKDSDLANVLKIPTTEGHVFRSKERTPILLLMEIRRDENMLNDDRNPSHRAITETPDTDFIDLSDVNSQETNSSDIGSDTPEDENEKEVDLLGIGSEEYDSQLTPKGMFFMVTQLVDISSNVTHSNHHLVSHIAQGILRSPKSSKSDAAEVENLISGMVQEKLKICLPDFDIVSSCSFKSCDSESNDAGEASTPPENCKQKIDQIENDDARDQTSSSLDEDPILNGPVLVDTELVSSLASQNTEIVETVEKTEMNNSIKGTPDNFVSNEASIVRKVSAFGSLRSSGKHSQATLSPANLAAHGEGRRQVLTTIFTRGARSNNLIFRGVAPAARRAVQAMDRKRAQLLMNAKAGVDKDEILNDSHHFTDEGWNGNLTAADSKGNLEEDFMAKPSDEDECVEAIRLLLVQNSVALGKISPENAVKALHLPYDLDADKKKDIDKNGPCNETDAGEIDSRLAGCGTVSPAVLSALKLWKEGLISHAELLDLVQKDLQYTLIALPGAENESILTEDSVFWGRFAFGERWAEKKARLQASSVFGTQSGWDLTGVIIKSNDDLRQEAFAMQLIELSTEAFEISGLELWTYPYRILATGRTTGVIEMVRNSMSFDSLKKRPGYSEGGLLGHFKKMAECAADPSAALTSFKKNFVRSLAAYSLLSYFFVFKDRHNGNLLLDTAGHVIHIDFGFIFGIAPGGSFSLESSVPFKMTEEMIEVMDGLGSVFFTEFVTLFCCGFLALQAHCETFMTIVDITCEGSTFNCFEGKDRKEIVSKLRERFSPDLSKEETISHAMELIRQACNATGTKQYDFFQYMSQGIAA